MAQIEVSPKPSARPPVGPAIGPSSVANPDRHPLNPLSIEEISSISLAIRKHIAAHTEIKAVKFIATNLVPPPKRDVLAYLGIPIAPGEVLPPPAAALVRKADVDFIDPVKGENYNVLLSFTDSAWRVDVLTKLPEGTQPQLTIEELLEAEEHVRNDETVIKLAAEVGVLPHQIFADGWVIGYDDRFPRKIRLQQCLLYARFTEDENIFAHPMDFFPILDTNTYKVLYIDVAPNRRPDGTLSAPTTAPPPLDVDPFAAAGRERIRPPLIPHDYLPDLCEKQPGFPGMRKDLKPLHVVQPEGVSFKMSGNVIEWQKWSMHIGFGAKEGIILSTVTYNDDGNVRPIFYRLSLAEMLVPYGAPEHPHPHKFAFDVGEYGMGTLANELSLGCDCLGTIHYMPGVYVGHNGNPVIIKNAICIHEEDAGLLWKHTDFRTGGRAHSVRSRKLVISMICTVANYEYCFYYNFSLDGTIELEVRLTGILNAYVLAEGEPAGPYGMAVAPRITAQNHQHLFSIRIDPMIDGLRNSVVETDIKSLDYPTGSAENFAGNGFYPEETIIKNSAEGGRVYDQSADRRWTIVNQAKKHHSSGKPVGYSLNLKGAIQTLLAREDSWAGVRAPFATKSLWVVREKEGEREWPAGRYVPQTQKAPVDSVSEWIKDGKSLDNEDIILFATIGVAHIPRPEDWPIMPSEHVRISFKPVGFFSRNPTLDVPGAADKESMLAFNGAGAAATTESHENCCS
ncbi:hypothetical protein BOTBODRAFT_27929 [Botryobasidium botryosum FD-172 SS1]|uniref:Amine oxidase n=1 Tax=Botryobasidium botryosum (strain FD-172 SS1) TaxID=930990 RepID=A0A067N5H5_BOTB1|nr:hypothetical protein BOTBODRAFT_27929 [Botryobasidium botryosum FD-172 SS1]